MPVRIPQKTCADNRSDNNADQNGKVTTKQPTKQTRVGRQIHTPARFVQLVYAVIAPNDIYCGGQGLLQLQQLHSAGFGCVRALGQKSYWDPIGRGSGVCRLREINSEPLRGSI